MVGFDIWTAPSIRSCFKNAHPQKNDSNTFKLDAAKGEFVSFQVLLRSYINLKDNTDGENNIINISGANISKVSGEDFEVSSIRVQAQEYIAFSDDILYPDPIANNCVVKLLPNTTQGIWVTIPVPEDQKEGEYKFKVEFESDYEGELSASVILNVFNVAIPKSSCAEYSMEHFTTPEDQMLLDHAGYIYKAFSDEWWVFVERYAKSLKECRSNICRLEILSFLRAAGSKRIAKDKWEFNFSLLDRMIDLFIKNGVVKKFATTDFLGSLDSGYIYSLNENGEMIEIDINEPEAEIWEREYFTALYEHILETSNPDQWIVHIQDEPYNEKFWLHIREQVRKYMPGLKCGNPFSTQIISKLGDNVELYIPLFSVVEKNFEFFQEILENPKKEIWAYCCCLPLQSWFLNRFIDRPAIQNRLIAWATYSQGFTGFLHYGYSYWNKTSEFYPYGIEKYSRFKGDCMLIYPSPEDNSYKISTRYINIRDGAQDYELLKLVEKMDGKISKELSKSVAERYTVFDMDEERFCQHRRKLLLLAEQAVVNKKKA